MSERYENSLRNAVVRNSSAYGYSILITGTVSLVSVEHRLTTPAVFCATGAAVTAFVLVEVVVTRFFKKAGRAAPPKERLLGSAMHFFSIGGGLGAALALSPLLDGILVWIAAPFVATVIYLLVEGIELKLASHQEGENGSD